MLSLTYGSFLYHSNKGQVGYNVLYMVTTLKFQLHERQTFIRKRFNCLSQLLTSRQSFLPVTTCHVLKSEEPCQKKRLFFCNGGRGRSCKLCLSCSLQKSKLTLSQELSDCIIYCKSVPFCSFQHSRSHYKPYEMSSFAESKTRKLIREAGEKLGVGAASRQYIWTKHLSPQNNILGHPPFP